MDCQGDAVVNYNFIGDCDSMIRFDQIESFWVFDDKTTVIRSLSGNDLILDIPFDEVKQLVFSAGFVSALDDMNT